MEPTENTAQAIVNAIREMFGLEGDVDVLAHVQQLREDERDAHAAWREAETRNSQMPGLRLITEEPRRQVCSEGWTPAHDDGHRSGELAISAARYAVEHTKRNVLKRFMAKNWPWHSCWWKPKNPIRNLARAGALIAAEIDRLKRLEGGTR